MSNSNDTLTKQFPIDFKLHDQDRNSVLYITDNPLETSTCLSVKNRSDKPIELKKFKIPEKTKDAEDTENLWNGKWADNEHHHFEIVFRKGTLLAEKPPEKIREADKNHIVGGGNQLRLDEKGKVRWNIKLDTKKAGDTVSLYILATKDEVIEPGQELHINLPNMSAQEGTGSRKTRVLFKCNNLSTSQEIREKPLNIHFRKGARQLPLHVGFVGSNTILNDGKTENELILRITNTLNNKDIILNGEANSAPTSKLALWFDVKEEQDSAAAWALANKDKVKAIELTDAGGYFKAVGKNLQDGEVIEASRYDLEHSNYKIEKDDQGDEPKWTAFFQEKKVLEPGEHIDFYLTHITTSLKTGRANLYLQYQNIPGYWDGQFICNIMKSPLVMRDKRVGIRTDEPKAALHVVGDFKVTDGKVGINTIEPDSELLVTGKLKITNGIEDDKGPLMPKGGIIMWSGETPDIPQGWALCNGTNSTPDLRDRFIVGAGGAYSVQDAGGTDTVALNISNMPSHSHTVVVEKTGNHHHTTYLNVHSRSFRGEDGNDWPLKDSGNSYNKDTNQSGEHVHDAACGATGGGESHENKPPYYALCFIMKL